MTDLPPNGPNDGLSNGQPQGQHTGNASPAAASPEEKNWALAAHLSWIAGSFIGGLYFIGPLVVYLIKKDSSPFVKQHATEALNFSLTTLIAFIVGLVLSLVVIGIFLIIAVGVIYLVLSIMAAIEASNGRTYRYPMCIRFIK